MNATFRPFADAVSLLSLLLLVGAAGNQGHRLKSGETWRPVRLLDAPGVNGAVTLEGRVAGAQIGPARIRGAYRAVETEGKGAVIRNLRITGLTATELERDGIRLRGDVEGVTIRDFDLRMRRPPQVRPHLPEGIALISGRRITIRDGKLTGFRLARIKGKYPNGDGVAAERAVNGLEIHAVEANDNADAGFDLKSRDTRLDQLTAQRNFRNYRFWGEVTAGTLTSVDPRSAHVWAGKGAVVRIERLIARSSTSVPLLIVEGAKEVTIERCELDLPPGTKMRVGNIEGARVKLGPGCRI